MTQWRRIEALISEPGPFIWRASRTTMTSIPLSLADLRPVTSWLGASVCGPGFQGFAEDAP
jgi:hypothetical protein